MSKKYAGEYPFAGAKEGKIGVKEDHALSGSDELMSLLEGQETATKQNVIERIASLKSVPSVYAVRTIIVQESQRIGYAHV